MIDAVRRAASGPRPLVFGRAIAVVQGVIWLAAMSAPPLNLGYVFALLAAAAAFVAQRNPARAIGLLLAPTVFILVVMVPFAAGSSTPVATLAFVAAMTAPAVVAAGSIRIGIRRSGVAHDQAATGRSSVSVRSGLGAAFALGLLAVPFVAMSFTLSPASDVLANSGWASGPIDWQPVAPAPAVALALLAVTAGATVGGLCGSVGWRSGRIRAACLALAGAWAAAITCLPAFAAVLGIHLRSGVVCVMGCQAMLRDDQPFAGSLAYAVFVVGTAIVVWPAVVLAAIAIAVVSVRSPTGRRLLRHPSQLQTGAAIAGFAVLHGAALALTSTTNGGLIPYVCLAAGVIVWARWLDRRSATLPVASTGTPPGVEGFRPGGG